MDIMLKLFFDAELRLLIVTGDEYDMYPSRLTLLCKSLIQFEIRSTVFGDWTTESGSVEVVWILLILSFSPTLLITWLLNISISSVFSSEGFRLSPIKFLPSIFRKIFEIILRAIWLPVSVHARLSRSSSRVSVWFISSLTRSSGRVDRRVMSISEKVSSSNPVNRSSSSSQL